MRRLILWLAVVLALAGTAAYAATLPARPAGPVYDGASIIPDAEEAALDAKLRAYNQATGRAVIVATVPSLEGEDVATYNTNLGQIWGAGGTATDQGLILLIAPTERKLNIATGYGLEAYIPDVLAGRIIRETITPKFKAGDMPGGIAAGVDAIIAQLDRDPADAKAVAEAAAAAAAADRARGDEGFNVGSVIFWIVLIIVFSAMFGGRRRGGVRRSGINPGIVLWGVSEILRNSGNGGGGGGGWGGGSSSSGGGGFGGFGGGGFGGGGASGSW